MMTHTDIRWQQRFTQFNKAHALLTQACAIAQPNVVEQAGLIQFFEMAFELACKLLKDYGEAQGYTIQSPRDAIKQAFQAGYINDSQVWMDALEDRNLSTHIYDESIRGQLIKKIIFCYAPLLKNLLTRIAPENKPFHQTLS